MFKRKTYHKILHESLEHAKLELLRAKDAQSRAAADAAYAEDRLQRLQAALEKESNGG